MEVVDNGSTKRLENDFATDFDAEAFCINNEGVENGDGTIMEITMKIVMPK